MKLTARLTDERGNPISSSPIRFRAGNKTLATRSTDESGVARLKLAPTRTAAYRAIFAGTAQIFTRPLEAVAGSGRPERIGTRAGTLGG